MLLVDNLRSRWRDLAIRVREARGELYPLAAQKREQWGTPTQKRDSLARLLRFRARLARERQKTVINADNIDAITKFIESQPEPTPEEHRKLLYGR